MASGEEDEGEFDLEDFDHFVNSGVRRQGGWGLTMTEWRDDMYHCCWWRRQTVTRERRRE